MTDSTFEHSTPALYDRYMGPLLFEPYARLIAGRCALLKPSRVLETAVGSGILTRAVHAAIPEAELVATDLNSAMLEFAAHSLRSKNVSFQPADAQNLPFADGSFDLVLCQFGVMFFRDRIRANHEAHRVLRNNGHFLLSTFNQLGLNPIPKAAQDALSELFGNETFNYMEQGPFCYADPAQIERDLLAGGFTLVEIETVQLSSKVNAHDAAQGLVLGSPLRSQIEKRDPSILGRAVEAVARALSRWEGKDAPISAHVISAK